MGNRMPTNCPTCHGVTDWGTFANERDRAPTCICEPVAEVSQATSCGSGEDIQATACEPFVERERCAWRRDSCETCACEKYLFPTFEIETLDWSWEPITDDDGIHQPDRCLFGVSESEKEDDQ